MRWQWHTFKTQTSMQIFRVRSSGHYSFCSRQETRHLVHVHCSFQLKIIFHFKLPRLAIYLPELVLRDAEHKLRWQSCSSAVVAYLKYGEKYQTEFQETTQQWLSPFRTETVLSKVAHHQCFSLYLNNTTFLFSLLPMFF